MRMSIIHLTYASSLLENNVANGTTADAEIVQRMNPVEYIATPGTTVAGQWGGYLKPLCSKFWFPFCRIFPCFS